MEQRLISYTKGITTSPGELLAEDGELLECINLKCENGELKPLLWPEESEFTLGDGEELLFVHKTSDYKNYVVRSDNTIKFYYLETDGSRKQITYTKALADDEKEEDISITAIGNTLVINTYQPFYVLFKNGNYIELGYDYPQLTVIPYINQEGNYYDHDTGLYTDKENTYVEGAQLAAINAVVNNGKGEGGCFGPFLFRYCYELYDGSFVNYSIPVIMYPTSRYSPVVVTNVKNSGKYYTHGRALKLKLRVYISQNDDLERWSDVISNVIFAKTTECPMYDQNNLKTFNGYFPGNDAQTKEFGNSWGIIQKGYTSSDGESKTYIRAKISTAELIRRSGAVGSGTFVYPIFSNSYTEIEEHVRSTLRNLSVFYMVGKVDTKSILLNNVDKDLSVNNNNLEVLTKLEDGERTDVSILSKNCYAYNNRVIYGPVKKLTKQIYMEDIITNNIGDYYPHEDDPAASDTYKFNAYEYTFYDGYVKIEESNKSSYCIKIKGKYKGYGYVDDTFLYYPHNYATSIQLKMTSNKPDESMQKRKYHLASHPFLNGCYSYKVETGTYEEPHYGVIDENNLMCVSEVNNPFAYDNFIYIGTGEIISFVANTRALSQGQFGHFPLLCFATDGIWSLEVGNDGSFSAKQAISREICNNKYNIVQTDDLVYFSTEKGLMRIIGSDVQLVSPQMTGPNTDVNDMKRMGDMSKDFSSNMHGIVKSCSDEEEFVNFLRKSRAGYNYREASIYFTNKDFDYMYVYYISNNTVVKLYNPNDKVVSFVNDYPDTLASGGEKVYSLLTEHNIEGAHNEGFAMTRALKLGNPASLKKIRQLKNLKNVYDKDSAIKCSLWGSNDNINWYPIGNMRGIFKYYRMGLFTRLRPTEGLSGSVIMIEEKRNNKLR